MRRCTKGFLMNISRLEKPPLELVRLWREDLGVQRLFKILPEIINTLNNILFHKEFVFLNKIIIRGILF